MHRCNFLITDSFAGHIKEASLTHWFRGMLMTTVIRTWIGQGTLVHIVPVGSGQLFLVGHMSLNLFFAARERKPCCCHHYHHNACYHVQHDSINGGRAKCSSFFFFFTSASACLTGLQRDSHNHIAQSHRMYSTHRRLPCTMNLFAI